MNGSSSDQDVVCGTNAKLLTGRRASTAAYAILVLAGLYGVHGVASFAIAPLPKLTPGNAIGGALVVAVMEILLLWSSRTVRRGGSLVVAAVMVALCLCGGGLGAVLSSRSTGPNKAWFVVLQFLVFGWALLTLVLLLFVHDARTNARAAAGGR